MDITTGVQDMDALGTTAADDLVRRIERATNAHDLESLVDCFDEGFVSETPAHPARDFQGRDQVRRNWGRIFDAVPDLSSTLVRSIVSDETAWAEWEWIRHTPRWCPAPDAGRDHHRHK